MTIETLNHRTAAEYGLALALVVAALGLGLAVDPWLHEKAVYIFLGLAILLAVVFSGRGPAVAGAVVSILAVGLIWSLPATAHGQNVMAQVSMIVALALTLSANIVVGGHMHKESRRADEAAHREALLGSLVLRSNDAIYTHSLNYEILSWNKGAETIFGYRAHEMIGRNTLQIIPRPLWGQHAALVDLVSRGDGGQPIETELLRKNGETFCASLALSPLFDEHHNLAGVCVIARDLSGRKRAESAILESERRFRATFEQAAVGMALVGMDGRLLQANEKLSQMMGYSREELLQRCFQDLCHPDDIAADPERFRLLSMGDEGNRSREVRCFSKEGRVLWVNLTCSLVHESSSYYIVVVEDITTRKHIDLALQAERRTAEDARNKAEQANAAKDKFLAVLSHELRTPLTPVLLTTSALEGDPTVPPHVREEIGMMRSNVETEAQLIDDLLDVTRLGAGKLEIRTQVADVHTVLKEAVDIIAKDSLAKQQRLILELTAEDRFTYGDPVRLRQVFWNLLSNAVKFTPHEGTIRVTTENAGEWLRIQVADTGAGISSERLPHIFEPFEQGGREVIRQFGGLGLGLAISKALVEMHHGTIGVSSPGIGAGATFQIDLPAGVSNYEGPGASPISPPPSMPSELRILLVEDHVPTANALARLLRRRGYFVITAHSVKDAKQAADQSLDLLLTDVNLPDGSGWDLPRYFRDTCHYAHLKSVAFTGLGTGEDVRRSSEAGFEIHLTKPIAIEELEQTIAKLFEGRGCAPEEPIANFHGVTATRPTSDRA